MPTIGFNFTKLLVEKKKSNYKNINVKSNLSIQDIKDVKSDIINKPTVVFEFDFNVDYEPDIASIQLKGSLLYSTTEELHKKIIDGWGKKKVIDEIKEYIFNSVLTRCNVKSLQLEEEFSLPYHIPLPKYRVKNKKDSKDKTEKKDNKQ